ncbi:MAG: hypothetical protein AAGE94_05640, partial [Acidobacteriota bacterium]
TDPDGDGVAEDLVYVDCQQGKDSLTCGSADEPCGSIDFAWTQRADGVEDGAEDVICFRGRCAPRRLTPAVGGVTGHITRAASGSRARAFDYPSEPTMLVGWDTDGDGEYPPHDPDDVAILDGGGDRGDDGGLDRAFVLTSKNARLEMAHFEVHDYGRYSAEERSGFVSFHERGGLRGDHFYFHDLELRGINQDQPTQGFRIVFDFFTGGTAFHHVAFENLAVLDVSGFMVRGSGPYAPPPESVGGDDGPYRWQHLSVTAHGCDHSDPACRAGGGSAFVGWKLWGYLSGVEILDSVFDANVAAWEPKPNGNGGALWVYATQCTRDWTVRGNRVRDFKVGFRAEGGDGPYCGRGGRQVPRRTGELVFEDNHFWNTYGAWRMGDVAVELRGGDDVDRTLDEVVVRDNVLASVDGFDACIWVDVGHGEPAEGVTPTFPSKEPGDSTPGTIRLDGNTCWGSRAEGRTVGLLLGSHRPWPHRQDDIVLDGNVFAGLGENDLAIRFLDRPTGLSARDNVFAPAALYVVGGGDDRVWPQDLDGLEAALEMSLDSIECVPAFVDPLTGDFRLLTSDGCVRRHAADDD